MQGTRLRWTLSKVGAQSSLALVLDCTIDIAKRQSDRDGLCRGIAMQNCPNTHAYHTVLHPGFSENMRLLFAGREKVCAPSKLLRLQFPVTIIFKWAES